MERRTLIHSMSAVALMKECTDLQASQIPAHRQEQRSVLLLALFSPSFSLWSLLHVGEKQKLQPVMLQGRPTTPVTGYPLGLGLSRLL